jgi:glycosyltransferase involved in cell wall biosynthesis
VRVLFVHEQCGFQGGVEQNVAETALGLKARGHACHLAYLRQTARGPDEFAARFEGVHPVGDAGEGELARVAAEVGPDVVYYHKWPSLPDRPRLSARRAVRMIHDHDICCPRSHKYFVWPDRTCHQPAGLRCWADLAFLCRNTSGPLPVGYVDLWAHARERRRNHVLDACLVGSRFMRDELAMNGFPPDRVHIVPPAVRVPGSSPPVGPAGHRILFVGQVIRGKGVDLLLQALARVEAPWDLDIVGDGNARSGLEAIARDLGLADRVRFHGFVASEGLAPLYDAARIVAVPSRWPEPFGMVGLEAMHRGRPVVAFAVGGIPDWCLDGETGLLAPDRDVPALADRIGRLLRDDGLAGRLGARARVVASERFGFEGYLDRLASLLAGAPGAH